MTQETDFKPMSADEAERKGRRSDLFALEVLFLGFIAVLVILAFIQALSYKIVSSRTPFVIMVPLLILIAVHARRLWRVRKEFDLSGRLLRVTSWENRRFKSVVGFSVWMVILVAMITVFGHYAAIFLFCTILMRFLAQEPWGLTLAVAAGTTFFLFGVFEFVFDVELYRGLIVRYFLGFRDF